jgi:hypothetical protein
MRHEYYSSVNLIPRGIELQVSLKSMCKHDYSLIDFNTRDRHVQCLANSYSKSRDTSAQRKYFPLQWCLIIFKQKSISFESETFSIGKENYFHPNGAR